MSIGTGAGMQMQVAITTRDETTGEEKTSKVDIELTVADQRALAERQAGGPVFRMWLTEAEKKSVQFVDWTCYRLKDGRYAVWRSEADLALLQTMGEIQIHKALSARRLSDDIE